MLRSMLSRSRRRFLHHLIFLGTLLPASAELTLTNFSTANPIKIMAIGDSITDDCVVNGAWRIYLQPMLETNGFQFTFVGRQTSIATPATFTKTKHEGYCGAVIGAPGVVAGSVHGYIGTDVYLQKIVGQALTNTFPDVVLVMIGANDIGRGRNPHFVVTNSMVNLLNLIYSRVPNANVILTKITTLENAGLGYSAYAANVPIYNSRLQSLVNQKRALGTNAFLADLFSAVDYSTMFNADHLHPNAAGLNAIASEWLARIQSITIRTNQANTVLINGGANWKYSDDGQDLGTNWAQPNFDDSSWSNGVARLGYGSSATVTTVDYGPEATNKFVTTYFRRSFVVPWNTVITNLNFRLARADGAIVWLNGQEFFRANMPAGPITYTNLALSAMTGYTPYIFYPTNFASAVLLVETNWVTVEVHQSSATNASMGFDMELIGSGYFLSPPALSIMQSSGNIQLSWPVTNGNGFTLYSTTNLGAGGWLPSTAMKQTNSGQIVVTHSPDASGKFFRLLRP